MVLMTICAFCACQQEYTTKLTVMSYNIRHGVGMDTILDLSRAAKVIKHQAPDLCALQEIDNFCARSDSIGQTQYLAEKTGMEGTFGEFMDYQGGQYGMATLSSKPLRFTKVLKLPDGLYEPRSAIIHEVEVSEGRTILFANVHLDWIGDDPGEKSRLNQAQTLVRFLDSLDKAVIITGDFNCTPDSSTMQFFRQQGFEFVDKGTDHLSFQGAVKAEIDHLIFRNSADARFKVTNTELLEEPIVSDHRPLITKLEVIYDN